MADGRRLDGRTAIVFGGGHGGEGPFGVVGIGFACAATFAAHGANVAVVDRDQHAAHRGAAAIVAAGGRSLPVVADLLDEAQVMAAVEATLERFGRIDVVQNNVGLVRLGGPEELTLAEWRAAVSVNLDSVFLGAKATLAQLSETRGSMINVSSTGSIRWTGYPYPAYAASKAAVNQLTRSLALQYADRGVRVNAILAGLIDTPFVYRELGAGQDPSTVRAERRRGAPPAPWGRPRTWRTRRCSSRATSPRTSPAHCFPWMAGCTFEPSDRPAISVETKRGARQWRRSPPTTVSNWRSKIARFAPQALRSGEPESTVDDDRLAGDVGGVG